MAEKCKCGCFFTWLSGFFAMPAIGHIIRIIMKWDVTWQGVPVSMGLSWFVIVTCGLLAIIFGIVACKKKKDDTAPTSCC
jgi:hypothetical protein